MQAKDLALLAGDDESWRLVDVDLLLQVTVDEGRLDVHVVGAPALLSCQHEKEMHGLHPCNRCEIIVEVDSLLLHEPACNQSSLMLDDRTGFIFLQLEQSFDDDRTVTGWEVSQLPGPISLNGVHL